MSATEVLRRLLDERGVEWDYGIGGASTTRFTVNGVDLTFTPMRDGLVCSTILTPAQAIAATLGTGTCKRVMDSIDPFDMWVCDHCGHPLDTSENFCGGCGRKVVNA